MSDGAAEPLRGNSGWIPSDPRRQHRNQLRRSGKEEISNGE